MFVKVHVRVTSIKKGYFKAILKFQLSVLGNKTPLDKFFAEFMQGLLHGN